MYEFEASLWRWREDGAWHFVTVPDDVSDDIDEIAGPRAGFGSVRVEVTIGTSTWRTSVFPSKELSAFILPVKRSVRMKQRCGEGDTIRVRLALIP